MVMYDENRKFTKLIKFMAENYYSNNSELNEAVSAFEDAIETSGNGEASFGVAGEDWERVEISQPPYTYPDAQFYALYDNPHAWVLADVEPVEDVWYYDHPNGAVIWVKDVSPVDEMQDERLRYGY